MYPQITRLYTAGQANPPDPWYIDERIHANRIYYIIKGTGHFTIGKNTYKFQKGHLYFIPASDNFTAVQDFKPLLHTFFDFEIFPPVLYREPIDFELCSGNILLDSYYQAAESLLMRIMNSEKIIIPPAAVKNPPQSLYELLIPTVEILLAVICAEANVAFVEDCVVLNALISIHRDIDRLITIESLAADAYMRTDCFIRRFRSYMGITPYAYLRNLRLRTAVNLRDGGMKIAEIFDKVGYSNGTSLSHALARSNKESI